MAHLRKIGPFAELRSDASNYILHFRRGRLLRSGRGLVFWFVPATASIAEIPMDDREMAVFAKGRSQDFQTVSVQGALTWHVTDPGRLAERVDFSIGFRDGRSIGEPIERIEARLAGVTSQAVIEYLAAAPVRALLDAGLEPLRLRLTEALADDPGLAELGISVVALRLAAIAPTSELERALQTPTFEALQQKADQATFERRALAVDKERAIAENELANKTELARREKLLIAEEAGNARSRATSLAEARQIEAAAEAERIRTVEGAKAEAERSRIDIYRDLPPNVQLGLAARELAGKLTKIEHLNVTPDLLTTLLDQLRRPAEPARQAVIQQEKR